MHTKSLSLFGLTLLSQITYAATCQPIAGPDAGGQYPHLFEKIEMEQAFNCSLKMAANPASADLNKRIAGNPALPGLAERLPTEPLVVAPYTKIGGYGGTLKGLSKATESGTSDLLSVRHVNLVRYSDDLSTIVPNIAKSWEWNNNFTVLTMKLRKDHKWSDGQAFTAADIAFWYHSMLMDQNIIKSPKERFLSDGKPMKIEALDDTTVRITLNAPKPGLLSQFATDYAQPFQPSHLLSRFHPEFNKNADKLAQELGFKNGYEVINLYYGQSDWKDVPTPLLKDPAAAKRLVAKGFTAVAPTLESHVVVEDTLEGRRLVANPYFFQVDTAGNQLPYINEIREVFVGDEDIQTTKLIAGDVTYKAQAINLPAAPVLLENKGRGDYSVALRPTIGVATFSFNLTSKNKEKRNVFNELNFRRAMSVAINRDTINKVAFFGMGEATQYTAFDGDTVSFIDDKLKKAWTQFSPSEAGQLLDAIGVVDKDNDGHRDLPSGAPFTLNINFTTQKVSTEVVEIVAANWSDAGIRTTIKEVSTDEYRATQSANDLEVHVWNKGLPLAVLSSDIEQLIPPYGSFFELRNGLEWAKYIETDGKEGIKPPASVDTMAKLANTFTTLKPGTKASNELGRQIAQQTVDDLFFIGTVKAVAPIYHDNALINFETPKTWSYEYYRVYPYLTTQWSLNAQ